MKKKIIIAISLLFVLFLIFAISLQITSKNITGMTMATELYSYTRAICDDSNYCQDYKITCMDNQLISKDPLPGGVQHNKNWEDPRNDSEHYSHCKNS